MSPSDKNSTGEQPTLTSVGVRPLVSTPAIAAVSSSCHTCAPWFQTDPDEQYMKLEAKSVSRSPSDLLKLLLSIIFTHVCY